MLWVSKHLAVYNIDNRGYSLSNYQSLSSLYFKELGSDVNICNTDVVMRFIHNPSHHLRNKHSKNHQCFLHTTGKTLTLRTFFLCYLLRHFFIYLRFSMLQKSLLNVSIMLHLIPGPFIEYHSTPPHLCWLYIHEL